MQLRRGFALSLSLSLLVGIQIPALAADESPQWEATSDTGSLGDDVARFVSASPTLNMVNQGLDTVIVAGNTAKPAALNGAGANDLDIGTTAYDANTGAVRWKATYDGGLGVSDQIAAFEANYHNNLVYEMVNSGSNLVTIERGVRDGKVSRSAVYPGASARDSAISSVGGFLGVVGSKGSDMLVLTYQTGSQTLELDARPVAGKAHSADISHTGSLDATRTILVTGQSSGFGTGGDMYTVAYNYRTGAKLWESSWASPNNKADEGLVAESAHVGSLNKAVGFVAGRTFTPETGWDILVSAFDLATGAPVWPAPVRFDGEGADDDTPTHLTYSDATSILYLTGTSERGFPHGQDVMTMALDAASGNQVAVAYAAGDSSNADDSPTGVALSKDGQRFFVAADIENRLGSGSRQAAVFAYGPGLAPAGSRIVGAAGDDRSAGVALNVAQDRVFLAGSTRSSATGFDHRVSSFAIDAFVTDPIEEADASTLAFTAASATSGQYSDTATLEALLQDNEGAPLGGQPVTMSLAGLEQTVTTDAEGLARATFELFSDPGTYSATAGFSGDDSFLASQASAPFEITREDVGLAFTDDTIFEGDHSDETTLAATLVDDSGVPLAGRDVVLALGNESATVTTDEAGVARSTFPLTSAPGTYPASARFGGDTHYVPGGVTASFEVTKEDSAQSLTVAGNGSKRTLKSTLYDADSLAGIEGRTIVFMADGVVIGTATTDRTGTASFVVPPGYRGGSQTFTSVFEGDDLFLGSQSMATTS